MSEKTEKTTASSKLDSFLSKNKKGVIITFVVVLVLLIGFLAFEIIKSTSSTKDLAKVEALYYELVDSSSDLDETAITKRSTECLEKLAPYTKKGGIVGVRANMLSAELAYIQADYEDAITYYDAAVAKGKKSYTAPICLYNKGSCLEELNKLSEAAEAYRAAAEFEDFGMITHAYFSLGRVLEATGDYAGAVEAYKTLSDKLPDDDWGNLAKTRLIELKNQGKY
jgi:tetratricopeptide (TPR) repeat protein